MTADLLTRLATHRNSRELRGATAEALALYDEAIEALKAGEAERDALREALETMATRWEAQAKAFAPGMVAMDKPPRTTNEHIGVTYTLCARQARAALGQDPQ